MIPTQYYVENLAAGDFKTIGRCITMVENDLPGSTELLLAIQPKSSVPLIGITGPPGAGKSSLVNALIGELLLQKKRIGIVAVDPTSPFNLGSILGDRVRMSDHFNHPDVFIRSIANRGSLGGLSAKIIEITDVMRASNFDVILVETVGVGQSEIEIVGLADITLLVLVPEGGDEIQQLKSGIMEIADIFVINKSDRPGADVYHKNLFGLLHSADAKERKQYIVKTVATKGEGINELWRNCEKALAQHHAKLKSFLLTEKAYKLIQQHRMKSLNKAELSQQLNLAMHTPDFNLYGFVAQFIKNAQW